MKLYIYKKLLLLLIPICLFSNTNINDINNSINENIHYKIKKVNLDENFNKIYSQNLISLLNLLKLDIKDMKTIINKDGKFFTIEKKDKNNNFLNIEDILLSIHIDNNNNGKMFINGKINNKLVLKIDATFKNLKNDFIFDIMNITINPIRNIDDSLNSLNNNNLYNWLKNTYNIKILQEKNEKDLYYMNLIIKNNTSISFMNMLYVYSLNLTDPIKASKNNLDILNYIKNNINIIEKEL